MENKQQDLMTSDQYVVAELLATKEKLEEKEQQIKFLKEENKVFEEKLTNIADLLAVALEGSMLENEGGLVNVYVDGNYMGLFREGEPDYKPKLQALAKLITMVCKPCEKGE